MFGEQKIAFTVSQKAINLVQSGKAVISSGGVRLLDGSLAEDRKSVV